jgi:DNA-binding NtrC family response regulator
LQNVVERVVLMCDGQEVLREHLPPEIVRAAGGDGADAAGSSRRDGSLWDYERAMIVNALTDNHWNQSAAARALGISRDNLRYRIKKYNIEKPKSS